MNYIGARLKYLRNQDKVTQQQLATALGVGKSTISMYESGQREPDFETLEKLADYFNVNMATFFPSNEMPANGTPYSPSKHVAPILGRIPAGYPVFAASEIEGYAPIDYSDTENYFWLRVSGDSMVNADILDGDFVLIRYQSCADDGQIVAARVNGDEATLKRFHQSGETVMLVPENPKYSPIPVPVSAFASGEASIIGVVVELKRKFV